MTYETNTRDAWETNREALLSSNMTYQTNNTRDAWEINREADTERVVLCFIFIYMYVNGIESLSFMRDHTTHVLIRETH